MQRVAASMVKFAQLMVTTQMCLGYEQYVAHDGFCLIDSSYLDSNHE
jgi:hypothetical protein